MKIGIIGGSGLDDPDILKNSKKKEANTPYGEPSSPLTTGTIDKTPVVILARHGNKHQLPPSKVNYRANIAALKAEGCTHIIATTAVGSLKENIRRGDFIILDQFIDFTRHRTVTFHDDFKEGPIHASLADPFSEELRKKLIRACEELGLPHHKTGTVITIEGPRFSTRAESRLFQQWGADVINMSIAPEAALAREAGIEYAAVAMSTDYDCWKKDEEAVTWEDVLATFKKNTDNMLRILVHTIKHME